MGGTAAGIGTELGTQDEVSRRATAATMSPKPPRAMGSAALGTERHGSDFSRLAAP
jgi:hypothetical protein